MWQKKEQIAGHATDLVVTTDHRFMKKTPRMSRCIRSVQVSSSKYKRSSIRILGVRGTACGAHKRSFKKTLSATIRPRGRPDSHYERKKGINPVRLDRCRRCGLSSALSLNRALGPELLRRSGRKLVDNACRTDSLWQTIYICAHYNMTQPPSSIQVVATMENVLT